MAQQLKKLSVEDFVGVKGHYLDGLPCGASTPNPEEDLEKSIEHLASVDRAKWLGYIQRSKNVREGYTKWWAQVSIALRDGRRIIIGGNGYFCLRTKDSNVFYYYQFDAKDFAQIKSDWNAIKDKEK